jgi:hypothetical protein
LEEGDFLGAIHDISSWLDPAAMPVSLLELSGRQIVI